MMVWGSSGERNAVVMPENKIPNTTWAIAKRLRLRRRASSSSSFANASAIKAARMRKVPARRGTTYCPNGEAAVGCTTRNAGCSSAPSDAPPVPASGITPSSAAATAYARKTSFVLISEDVMGEV
jgi:hypothetical protein